MDSVHLPNVANLKAKARRFRASREAQGRSITHSRALELVAKLHGFHDWNTAAAIARRVPVPSRYCAGSHVVGRYLGREFEANVIESTWIDTEKLAISLDLWEPIDVVESPRFSALRRRIKGVVGLDGRSAERLSNGTPQLELLSEASKREREVLSDPA